MTEEVNTPLIDPTKPVTSTTPPVKKPEPTYEEAMSALKTKTATSTPFYGTGTLAPSQVDYSQAKKYLDQSYGFSKNRDNEDFYAQQQGIGGDLVDLVSAVGLKLPALAATKTIGGLGFVTSLLNPTNWTSEDGFIASASDNAISKWAESAEETVKNEFLPTFQEAADVNKGFFSRAFTDLDFWTNDVVDGAAFMASAFIPGMALSKLGTGAKLAQMLSRTRMGVNAAGEVVNGLETAQRYLGSAQKFAKGFDAATTWAIATASESMYEASDVRKNVLASLDGKINPTTGVEYTEEEKKVAAGGAARNTFLMNAALLGATNALQMKYLFKALGVAESTVGRVTANTAGDAFERGVAKTKWGKFLDTGYSQFAKGVAIGTLSEGYVEENTQLAIQRLNQEFGGAGKVAGIEDYTQVLKKAGKQIVDATMGDDQEAATSIGLGAILGGVMGGVGNAKQLGRDRITTDQAIQRLNESQGQWLKFGNLYDTIEDDVLDTEGNPTGEKISKLKLDENNQPIVNESKLGEIITNFSLNSTMAELADTLKDKNQAKYLRDISFRNYVQAHIEAGIEDTLTEKLDQASNASPEALAKMGFDPSSREDIGEYKTLAKQIIAQNNLIKNSILITGKPAEENARINRLTGLADEQSILTGIVNTINKDVEAIKAQTLSPETSNLSDMSVDAVNSLQFRIDSQKAFITALEAGSNNSTKLKVARQLLAELNKEKAKYLKDNSLSLENLTPSEGGYYSYENSAKNTSSLNIAYQKSLMEKAQYQNTARAMGLEFALYADTKNGLKNFRDSIEQEIVAPINQHLQEEEVRENLQVTTLQVDPNDPRIKEINDRRDTSIEELEELYEEDGEHVVELSKDGIVITNIKTGVETRLEDLVPGQISDELKDQLDTIQQRINKINEDTDQEIKSLNNEATPLTETPAPNNPEVVASEDNVTGFYVFDGQNIKKGFIFNETSTGKKYEVVSESPEAGLNVFAIRIKNVNDANDTKSITSLDGLVLEGLQTETEVLPANLPPVDLNGPNKFKIKRVNELIRIYPHQNEVNGKRESIPAAQKRLDEFLANMTKEDIADRLTMTVSKGGPRSTTLAGESTGNPNGNLEVNSDYLNVRLEYAGLPIGYITNYTHYSVRDKQGKNLPIEKLTIAQFSEIFDTTGVDAKQALDTFKQNFIKGRRLFSTLSKVLGNSVSTKLTEPQIEQMLDLNISVGEFDNALSGEGVKLSELEHSTINGYTYVLDRVRKYKNGKFTTQVIPITNAIGADAKQIAKEVKEAKAKGRDLTEQLGRYVAVVKLPNGTIRFVQLSSDPWNDTQFSDLVSKINERSKLSKENNLTIKESKTVEIYDSKGNVTKPKYTGGKDETYNDVLNDEIASSLFIALPLENRGTYVDFYVNAMGNLQVKFNIPQGSNTIKHSIVVKESEEDIPLNFEDIDQVISRINEAIVKYNQTAKNPSEFITVTLTKDNFKNAISSDIGSAGVNNLSTFLNPPVVKNIQLTYNPKDTIEAVIPATPAQAVDTRIQYDVVNPKTYKVDPAKVKELNQATSQDNMGVPIDEALRAQILGEIAASKTVQNTLSVGEQVTAAFDAIAGSIENGSTDAVQKYAQRIVNGESRESVINGLGPNFIQAIDNAVKAIQSNPTQTAPAQTGSFKELSDEIKANQMEYIRTKSAELIAEGLTAGKARIQATQQAKVIYGKQLDELKAKLNVKNGRAFKVISREKFEASDVEHIDKFNTWVKDNLPEFISVEEVNDLTKNLSTNKITVGMFVSYLDTLRDGNTTIKGRINIGENTPYKYHEAFHAAFRLLLNDKQITQLRDIAKRELKANKVNIKSALEEFKQLHPSYDNLTPTELEELYYEEYLADRFDDWKSDNKVNTSYVAKGFFAKIMEWIKRLFTGRSFTDIENLFSDIDNGKYRNSNLQQNQFTREESNMITTPALKVIKVGEDIVQDENGNDIVIDRYLSQQEGDQLAASISSIFYDRLTQVEQYNKKQLLESILDEYKELYNPYREDDYYSNEIDRLFPDESQEADMENYLQRLQDRYTVFSEEENRASLLEAVDVHLRLMGFKQSLDSDVFDEAVDEYGDRVTTDSWKETHSIGGFGSLSNFLRQYIATTTFEYIDEFGNSQLKDGVPLLQAVNANLVYNGMLKAVANIGDQNMVMNRLRLLKSDETETGKFITKFFNDAGIEFNEDGTWVSTNPQRARLVQQVIKGFNQYSVDYLFINKDIREEAKMSNVMLANRRDSAKTQFSSWQNAYIRVFQDQVLTLRNADARSEFYDDRVSSLKDLYTLMDKDLSIEDDRLEIESKEISNQLKNDIGISLDPAFVKFSIVSNKDASVLTEAQKTLINAYAETYFATREDIQQIIRSIQSGEDPFSKNIDDQRNTDPVDLEEGEEEAEEKVNDLGKGGVITRINNLAKGNGVFDETVYSSSWKNADGELVYAHQLPTYHLVRIQQLNSDAYIDELKADAFLENNYLLNSEKFEVLQGDLSIKRIDGAKSSVLSKSEEDGSIREDKGISANKNKGITYGSFSNREFLTSLFDIYAYGKEYKTEDGGSFRTSQHLIRVLEASNTGDTLGLPVIKAVTLDKSENVKVSDEAADILYNEVVNEFERIKRVKDDVNNIGAGDRIIDEIDGYHYGTNKTTGKRDYSKGRGLTLYKTGLMLGDLKTSIEESALNEEFNISSMKSEITNQIKAYWEGQIADTVELLSSTGVITKNQVDLNSGVKQTYTNNLIDNYIQDGFYTQEGKKKVSNERKNSQLNIIYNKIEHNIGQVLVNDYINTLSLNQLLLGDQAASLKDGVDEVKRARGANASGASLESTVIAPQVGITEQFTESYILQFEDPQYRGKYSGGIGEKADAQTWGTVKSMRYTLHGLGKLDPFTAKMLDKIENGEQLTAKEIFGTTDPKTGNKIDGLKDLHSMFNSMKLVYYDGKMYIKTSFVMLTKELTSYNDNGTWKALPGKQELHDLREKLEDFESRNNTVAYSVPKSASKGLKVNVAASAKEAKDHNFQRQETKFWRLQLENPSNKLVITDPTQAKQLILAEQNDDTEVDFLGNKTSIGALKQLYLADTAQRVKNNYMTARNEIFDIEGAFEELSSSINLENVTPKLAKFQKRAVDNLRATGADSQLIDFFEVDKTGKPKYNLNNPITLDKYTQLFLAYFSKGVMSEKVPGHSIALMSNYGYKVVKRVTKLDPVTNQPIAWNIIRTDEVKLSPNDYAEAKEWNNVLDREFEGLKVGDYYIDDLRHNVAEYDEKGNIIGRYSEFVLPPHFAELMDLKPGEKIPEALAKAFGVRIPSQDKHSTISLRMVDTMPAFYGSTGIYPHELIEISGADFDIDKLYMHIADTYRKDGKRLAYGTAVTTEEKFDEYVTYMLGNNKDFKLTIRELKKDITESTISDDLEPGEALGILSDVLSVETIDDKMVLYKEALRLIGLPSTPKEYIDYVKVNGEINTGVLNNRILAQKIALVSNEYMVNEQEEGRAPIAFEVASVDPLKNIVNELLSDFSEVPQIVDIVNEGAVDTDSIIGKYKSFTNNKEGSRNIGPAVNSILAYSILSSFNINLRSSYISAISEEVAEDGKVTRVPNYEDLFLFKLNGHTFNTYSPRDKSGKESLKAFDPITGDYTGDRIFGSISTVVSAMTDNAKERLAARLGLNIEAIGYVTNMLAQGVPIKSAIRFLLQPSIREYFAQIKIANNKIKTGTEQQIKKGELLDNIIEKYSKLRSEEEVMDLTDDLLDDGLNTNGDNADLQYAVLQSFKGIKAQAANFSKVAKVLKLTKGLGTSFENLADIKTTIEELGLRMDNSDFYKSKLPFDLRQVFMAINKAKPYHEFMYNYIQTADQIDHMSQTMFIEKTPVFQRISTIVKENLSVRKSTEKEFNTILKRDLLSYLSIKAYMKSLLDNNKLRTLSTLDNAMIYDESAKLKGEDFNDIIDTFKTIRAKLPDNYFASKFVNIISTQVTNNDKVTAMNDLNRDGINKAEANTWAKLSEYQVEKLKDSFLEIYQNDDTRANAVDIFNYLLVKDAGQFKSNSFIRYIPTFMFGDLLKSTEQVNSVLKMPLDTKGIDQKYSDTFGVQSTDLFNEFMKSYTSHIGNTFEITKIMNRNPVFEETQDPDVKKFVPQSYTKSGQIKKDESVKELTLREKLAQLDPKVKDDTTKTPEVELPKARITINLWAGIRDEKEMFDTGTTQGIIQIKRTGKFNDAEKAKLKKNKALLDAKGFRSNALGKYAFPYVIVDSNIQGKRTYYKLIAVTKDSKDKKKVGDITVDESNPNRLIQKGEYVANGLGAIYEEYTPTGSRKSTMIGELFGPIPVIPKKPRVRKQFGNAQENTGRYSNMDASDIEQRMGLAPVGETVKKTGALSGNNINFTNSESPVDVLAKKFGITSKVTNKGVSFSGGLYNDLTQELKDSVKTPLDLLNLFGYNSEDSAEAITSYQSEPSADMYNEVPLPEQDDLASNMLNSFFNANADQADVDQDRMKDFADLFKSTFKNNNNPLDDNCA